MQFCSRLFEVVTPHFVSHMLMPFILQE